MTGVVVNVGAAVLVVDLIIVASKVMSVVLASVVAMIAMVLLVVDVTQVMAMYSNSNGHRGGGRRKLLSRRNEKRVVL